MRKPLKVIELCEYLEEHNIKFSRIAELMGKTPQFVIACFRHDKNCHGAPRTFSVENIRKLNEALPKLAAQLRRCVMTFGTVKVYTNKHGRTYDPGMIEPINRLGEMMNTTGLMERLLGWSKKKKWKVFSAPSSKNYGNISEDDVALINSEILSVAGVLQGIEVVSDDATCGGAQ